MKIRGLHYVFGPCLKGYDIYDKKVTVQMGQKTMGLSQELLSHGDILEKLEELAFGDTLEPDAPFEKVYFSPLADNRWVVGRGIRGMDSAGRGAYFFHHLVIEESDLIKINGNPFAILKKFQFFGKEADLPDNRLIPAAEIQVSEDDYRFPLVDSSRKPHVENLLSDLSSETSGQPVWVILKRGEERWFIEQLLGVIPFNERKQMGFSTDFYNSYNIQHYFRLVTVNREREIPYQNCTIYNFADGVFPDPPARKSTYLETISKLSPDELPLFVEHLTHLQLNYENIEDWSGCREILRTYSEKSGQYPAVFHEVVPLESAAVLLGIKQPERKPDYQAFCDFYRDLTSRIEPQWFKRFYQPGPVPLELFIALFKLLESQDNLIFKRKVFDFLYGQLETAGSAVIFNQLNQQFPGLIQDMLDYFREKFRWLFYLVGVPDLENLIRSRITGMIYREILEGGREQYFDQLPAVINRLDDFGMKTEPLKILVEFNRIEETKDFPDQGLEGYMIDEKQYRELMGVGMKIVNRTGLSLTKVCDYLFVASFNRIFIQMWLDFIQGDQVNIDPMELIIYWEKQNWVHLATRKEIFDFLGKGTIKFSRIKKYRKVLKKAKKDIWQYRELWERLKEKSRSK
ncbi:MAG: hypothetical protein PVH61_29380 [Candidatus Aminicenantes bacterium]|jgi:hypothetical protein